MVKIAFALFLLFFNVCAFSQNVPVDTSYTLHSTFNKLVKYYPEIKKVYPELPENILAQEDLIYRKIGERKLRINVYYPESADHKYPGVLLVHGGGWRSGDKSLQIPMAQKLAAEGYVTAVVEYRMSLEAPFPAAVHDLKAALRWMRAHAGNYNLETGKLSIYGASAGGQLAALVGTTNGDEEFEGDGEFAERSSDVQAIVDVDGVLAFIHPDSKESSMAAEWLGGDYKVARETWMEASALTHTGRNTPPILFVASSHPRFHAGKEDMIGILEKYEIYYESYYIPDSPHAFWLLDPWFEPTFNYTLNFLDKVLKEDDK